MTDGHPPASRPACSAFPTHRILTVSNAPVPRAVLYPGPSAPSQPSQTRPRLLFSHSQPLCITMDCLSLVDPAPHPRPVARAFVFSARGPALGPPSSFVLVSRPVGPRLQRGHPPLPRRLEPRRLRSLKESNRFTSPRVRVWLARKAKRPTCAEHPQSSRGPLRVVLKRG